MCKLGLFSKINDLLDTLSQLRKTWEITLYIKTTGLKCGVLKKVYSMRIKKKIIYQRNVSQWNNFFLPNTKKSIVFE